MRNIACRFVGAVGRRLDPAFVTDAAKGMRSSEARQILAPEPAPTRSPLRRGPPGAHATEQASTAPMRIARRAGIKAPRREKLGLDYF